MLSLVEQILWANAPVVVTVFDLESMTMGEMQRWELNLPKAKKIELF
jgi:hypothetical protein